jgi:ATP-dependent Clp protease protease subunit
MSYRNEGWGPFWGIPPEDDSRERASIAEIVSPVLYDKALAYSPESILFKNRIISLTTMVDPQSATRVKNMMLALDRLDYKGEKHQDIILYIDSPGGYVTAGLGIYDTMQMIDSDVCTVCTGLAASMGSLLLMAGAPGKRFSLPNSTIMVHELSGGTIGRLSQMNVSNDFSNMLGDKLTDIYLKHMPRNGEGLIDKWGGDTQERDTYKLEPKPMTDDEARGWLKRWAQKDRYMFPEQALAWGNIDRIIERLPGNSEPESLDDVVVDPDKSD